jgi:predicted nucleotidyltransferase
LLRNSVAEQSLISPSNPSGFCDINGSMKRDEIIRTLKEREADLRAHGVTHAALFGSVARDEQRPDSDIDILVDLDPAVVATMFDYAGLKDYVASLFEGSVDVIDREALKRRLRPHATADAIYAF